MKRKRPAVALYSELPHWISLEWLDDEAKRQLAMKDKPKEKENENDNIFSGGFDMFRRGSVCRDR